MTIRTREIQYQIGADTFTGYLADGATDGRAPGVLVAHEGGGLTEHAKARARMLARQGLVAFAMDTFGVTISDLSHGRSIVADLKTRPAVLMDRAVAALNVLKSCSSVDASRMAAIGFCFGGTTVLELAREGVDLRCVVGFHCGLEPLRRRDAAKIRCPILVCLGAADPIVGADQRASFVKEMHKSARDWRMMLYGGVGHSFTNREVDPLGLPGFAYSRAADDSSWRAMSEMFDETLLPGRIGLPGTCTGENAG